MEKLNILLLRGLARESRHWGEFPSLLEKCDQVGRVLCYDLAGSGARYEEESFLSIPAYVEDLREKLLPDLSKGKWAIMAISMGGMVALDWCSRYPNDFENAVVMNVSAKNLGNPLKRLSLGTVGLILKSLYKKSLYEREQGIKQLTTNINMDDSVIETWVCYAQEYPVSVPNFFKQITAAAKFKVSSNINLPVLILACENDHLAHVSNSKKLVRKLSNAKLELHQIAGHDLPLDDAQWVIEKFINWSP